MVWPASRPARRARVALAPAVSAALLFGAAVIPSARAQSPADSAAVADTAAAPAATHAPADGAPPAAGFQSADWETLSAGLPEQTHLAPIFNFRYNRVDGAALTLGGAVVTGDDDLKLLYGSFTYAFASERGLYVAGFNLPLGDSRLLVLEGKLYRRTWNWDQWIVGETENTIFGLVSQDDYRDYWAAKGGEASITWTSGSDFHLSVRARSEDQTQLETVASFAIFKKPDGFRANPQIQEGRQGVVVATIRVGPGDLLAGTGAQPLALGLIPRGEGAVNLVVSYARAGTPIVGDFEYDVVTGQIHSVSHPVKGQEARVRLIVGSTLGGTLPAQQVMALGGIGTLRGFSYKSIQGDQSFLANGEYYVPVRRNVYVFGFLDYGAAWFGLDNLSRQHPSLDGGLGIRLGQGPAMVTAARSLQDSSAPILIGVRLGGSF